MGNPVNFDAFDGMAEDFIFVSVPVSWTSESTQTVDALEARFHGFGGDMQIDGNRR